jgi:hypothetical protein
MVSWVKFTDVLTEKVIGMYWNSSPMPVISSFVAFKVFPVPVGPDNKVW